MNSLSAMLSGDSSERAPTSEQLGLTNSPTPDHKQLLVKNSVKNKKKRAVKDIMANFWSSSSSSSSKRARDRKQTTALGEAKISDVCLMSESPHAVHKAAAEGRLAELEKFYLESPESLSRPDTKGLYPIHHAATRGQLAALDFIISNGADMNAVDKKGNTALHAAVQADQPTVIDCLVQAGADTSILDASVRAPVHLAVELDKQDALQALLKYDQVDVDQPGELGGTALHVAAFTDHGQCAYLLLMRGAKMCKMCKMGRSPLHLAASSASSKTMQVFIKHADKAGYRVDQILAMTDQSKSLPIHSAVNSGDHDALRVCLEAGASIDAKQDDEANPVHLASSHGDVEMLKLMFNQQPGKKEDAITAADITGKTPMHMAAMFDRLDVVKYLMENGADMNTADKEGCTPVMAGANKKSWTCVQELLIAGCDASFKDNQNRNILHLIILNGGQPNSFPWCSCNMQIQQLSNQADSSGCTPLHYASMEGQLTTIDQLVCAGAQLAAKNNKKESPLHFAARYGRYNTCRRLLDSVGAKVCVNDTDEEGMSSLHVAASNGHLNVVQLLLQRGATPARDMCGNTPVHQAAAGGYTHTMNYLLSIHPSLINAVNRHGNTALHLAAAQGHVSVVNALLTQGAELVRNHDELNFIDLAIQQEQKDVCVAIVSHERWNEALDCYSSLFGCSMIGLIQFMPEVGILVLDKCRVPSGSDPQARDFHYVHNFKYLQISMDNILKMRKRGLPHYPLHSLNKMVEFNRVEFLSHPLCLAYMETKWNRYGMWFHMFNLLTYLVFLISLTCFVTSFDFSVSPDTIPQNQTSGTQWKQVEMGTGQALMAIIVVVFVSLNVLKELAQMIQQRLKYFADLNNALEWVLYITSGVFIAPFLNGQDTLWQWKCGAVAVFLAWLNLMLFLQRFDFFGIYVVMFLCILQTLLQVLIVFSILIIAFGMAFYILLSSEESFAYKTPMISLMTTIIMMMGNIEYIDTWVVPATDDNAVSLKYGSLTFIMLVVFLLLMPILLMNLLIGLAVGDIGTVQKDARLRRLAAQVELHTSIEKKLPQRLLELVHIIEYKEYPNCSNNIFKRFWNELTKNRRVSQREAETRGEVSEFDFVFRELHNQKLRWRKMATKQDKLYDMMKLVVQKMEIKTESDDIDESGSFPSKSAGSMAVGKNKRMSAVARQTVIRQALTSSKWASQDEK